MSQDQSEDRMLDGQGPLWEQIRRSLMRKIENGDYKPGEQIPPEFELMRIYAAARMTVHRAVRSLAAEGLVERHRKRGTIVSLARAFRSPLEIWDVEAETRRDGRPYSFELLEKTVGSNPLSSEWLNLPFPTPVLWTVGLHRSSETAIQLEERLTSLIAAPRADQVDYGQSSPGRWLLANVPWTQAEHVLVARMTPPPIAAWLEVPAGSPSLVVERKTWNDRGPVTCTRLWHPPAHRFISRSSPDDGMG